VRQLDHGSHRTLERRAQPQLAAIIVTLRLLVCGRGIAFLVTRTNYCTSPRKIRKAGSALMAIMRRRSHWKKVGGSVRHAVLKDDIGV
jgi:hypothetical protein